MSFFSGIFAYFNALRGISAYRLGTQVVIAGIISLVLGGATYFTVFYFGDDLGQQLIDFYPFEKGKNIIASITGWLSRILLGLLVFFVYKYLLLILLSPILSIISEKVEVSLTGDRGKRFSLFGEVLRAIRFNIRNLYKEIFYTLILLLLGLIPAFSPFVPFAIFLVQAYYLGLGFMDFYMERHFSFSESIRLGRTNRMWLSGLGTATGATLLLPFLGFFIAPILATIAATEFGIKKY